jgi:hypothetical protein
MIEKISTTLGFDVRELGGAKVDLDIPVGAVLVNRLLAEYLARGQGKIAAVVVEPRDGDRMTLHVRMRSGFVPPLDVDLDVVGQPELPASPVLVLRWKIQGGFGALARFASPALGLFQVLPPGIRIDGDLIGVDLAEMMRAKGVDWVLPFVKRVRLHTSTEGLRLQVAAGISGRD